MSSFNLMSMVKICIPLALWGCKERQTLVEYWDADKSRPKEIVQIDNETGLKDGSYKKYYSDGTLSMEYKYTEGKRNGSYKLFYKNGNLREEGSYEMDKKDGPYRLFYKNGNLREEGSYEMDKKDGPYRLFYENGNLREEGSYKIGVFKSAKIYTISGQSENSPMVDKRDGQHYRIVAIGNQIWMAEYLNYKTKKSRCFEDKDAYCGAFGREYTWEDAMDGAGIFSKNGKGCGYKKMCFPDYPVRGICPEGWLLPDSLDLVELIENVNGKCKMLRMDDFMVSQKKAMDDLGFRDDEVREIRKAIDGTNEYGFSAFRPLFWSSSQYSNSYAYVMDLSDCWASRRVNKSHGLLIRCVKEKP